MIRIRTGASWRDDPAVAEALRRAGARATAGAARAIVDALAIEVDGVDIAAGRAEGALLPSLEALLRAVARVVAGEPHAAVTFSDGALELVLRRRGQSALLTLVALTRPSRVLARDVEVELDALAAAALEGAASFCHDLAEVGLGAARETRRLQAAARDLRRTEAAPGPRPRAPVRARGRPAPGRVACLVELLDEEGVLLAYEGGRADLGSLLAPGRVLLTAGDGAPLAALGGYPFLALRDLVAGAGRVLAASRRAEPSLQLALPRAGPATPGALTLDLAGGTAALGPGAPHPCPPLDLVRAIAGAALSLCRTARARNPRQAENGYLAELESAASDRLAEADELRAGDLARPGSVSPGPQAAPARASLAPLGPGSLRRLTFRRSWRVDVGAPAGVGLQVQGGLVLIAGADALVALDRERGVPAWRTDGCEHARAFPGLVLAARGGRIAAHALRTGAAVWERPLPGGPLAGMVALARGPIAVAAAGALTGLDPATGRTLWRFEAPGGPRLWPAAQGRITAVAAESGFLYGLDPTGRLAWRVLAPGPLLRPPTPSPAGCLVLAEAGAGAVLLAVDPATGLRRWEAPLDLAPAGPPLPWGRRLAVPGTVAGDPAVSVVDREGTVSWTVAPPLTGAPALAAAGPVLVVRDAEGALAALDAAGGQAWSRPAPAGHPAPGAAPPVAARGTVLVSGEGVSCVDARLAVAALDADGVGTGHRLATHLSVVPPAAR